MCPSRFLSFIFSLTTGMWLRLYLILSHRFLDLEGRSSSSNLQVVESNTLILMEILRRERLNESTRFTQPVSDIAQTGMWSLLFWVFFTPFHRADYHLATHRIEKLSGCFQPSICYECNTILVEHSMYEDFPTLLVTAYIW